MPDHEILSIIARCKAGDRHAFASLCEHYYRYAFRLGFRILANEADAKDIVQEVFIRIWRHISTYDERIKFTTWMYTILTNLCIDVLRKQKHFTGPISEEVLAKVDMDDPESLYDTKELSEIISSIAEGLSPRQRVIFILRDLEGLGTEEIEKITGMPATSIKSNLCYARKAIREKLKKIYKVEY